VAVSQGGSLANYACGEGKYEGRITLILSCARLGGGNTADGGGRPGPSGEKGDPGPEVASRRSARGLNAQGRALGDGCRGLGIIESGLHGGVRTNSVSIPGKRGAGKSRTLSKCGANSMSCWGLAENDLVAK